MRSIAIVVLFLIGSGCEAYGPRPSSPSSDSASLLPQKEKLSFYLHSSVKFPATKEEIVQGMAEMPDFSGEEVQRVRWQLRAGSFPTPGAVLRSLGM
jgi:hypothetical protein